MIYRFDILAPSGKYDGWAKNPEEMQDKFHQQISQDEPCFVWFSGGAPEFLSYEDVERICDVFVERIPLAPAINLKEKRHQEYFRLIASLSNYSESSIKAMIRLIDRHVGENFHKAVYPEEIVKT